VSKPWSDVAAVFRKEVREGSRDRSLWISVVLVPLFLYPMLGFGALQVLQIIGGMAQQRPTIVDVSSRVPAAVRDSLESRERFVVRELAETRPVWALAPPNIDAFRVHVRDAASWPEENAPDAVLWWGDAGDSAVVWFDGSRDRSASAARAVRHDVSAWRHARMLDAFVERGLAATDLRRWGVVDEDIATADQRGRRILAVALPMILLYMLVTGTYYSALDAVVGERERGTLETLLTSPIRRTEILFGKYAFVAAASLTALLLNLLGMLVFLKFVISLIEDANSIQVDLSAMSIVVIAVTGLLLAGLVSAVMMMIVVPAQNFRQGQAALSPVMLLAVVPGLMVATSEEAFGVRQALIPVVNAVALLKSAIAGEFPLVPMLITFAMLAALTAAAIAFAARAVGNLEVLFDPQITLRRLIARGRGARS
jgi:sodium transport system permease protein